MPDCQKTALTTFFLVLNLFYSFTEGVQYFKENLNFPRFQRGSNIFQVGWGGGPNIFPEGPNANFYRNGYKVVIFQGGPDPTPPLDPRMFGLG